MTLDSAHLALRYAIQRRGDLSPPLGYPGGACQVIERAESTIRNRKLLEQLVQKIEDGEPLSNAEASLIYKQETEKAVRGTRFKGVFLTAHAQYRMDQRGIRISDVQLALKDFHNNWAKEKSKNSAAYAQWERAVQRSEEIRWESHGIALGFQAASLRGDIWAMLHTVIDYANHDPGPMDREDCKSFKGWSDLSVERVAFLWGGEPWKGADGRTLGRGQKIRVVSGPLTGTEGVITLMGTGKGEKFVTVTVKHLEMKGHEPQTARGFFGDPLFLLPEEVEMIPTFSSFPLTPPALLDHTPDRALFRHHYAGRRVAGYKDWLKWIVQPFDVIWKHHKEFIYGPVDDALDAIIRDLAPVLVKSILEREVDEDVDEFLEGATEGAFDAGRMDFPNPPGGGTEDWQEGYTWGFENPEELEGDRLPPRVHRRVVEEALQEFKGQITEQVVINALEKAWGAVNPVHTFKAIIVAVKKQGWKLGVGFALFEIVEHAVLPAALIHLTGRPEMAVTGTLPIGEVIYAVVLRILGRTPKEVDQADEDGHLDWYEDHFGPVRIASASASRVALRFARGEGDCYDANGRYFMEQALWPGKDANMRLVHGEVTGQGKIAGIKYGHCWIEDGNTVIDVSQGKTLRMPKAAYYALGRIGSNTHVYTPEQFQAKINQFEHWGPWDLKTSTGL